MTQYLVVNLNEVIRMRNKAIVLVRISKLFMYLQLGSNVFEDKQIRGVNKYAPSHNCTM